MPQFIKNDPEKLADYIAAIGRGLIAFDGRPSAGKTPLARDMARRLGCTAVDADKFLEQQQGAFVEKLRIADMRRTRAGSLEFPNAKKKYGSVQECQGYPCGFVER